MTNFNELETRIKLAEAMGWIWQQTVDMPTDYPIGQWLTPEGWTERGDKAELTPNPFKDANDDYAYLEWMREQPSDKWLIFCVHLKSQLQDRGEDLEYIATAYVVGDYARAALKVIDND